jgi:hypothetical protein
MLAQGAYPVGAGAGVIDLIGLSSPVSLVEDYPGYYPVYTDIYNPSYYAPGQEVTVTATGGEVPAFEMSATAPDQNLTLTAPEEAETSLTTLPTDPDLRYAWVAPSTGTVTVFLVVSTDLQDTTRLLHCSKSGAESDEMVVPLSQVDDLGQAVLTESVHYTSDDATTTAGPFDLAFVLRAPVVTAAGEVYLGRMLLLQ